MTKKDYFIVAQCINKALINLQAHANKVNKPKLWDYYRFAVQNVMQECVTRFPEDNPKFDFQRFKTACYKDLQ